jgi:hypothetical protein
VSDVPRLHELQNISRHSLEQSLENQTAGNSGNARRDDPLTSALVCYQNASSSSVNTTKMSVEPALNRPRSRSKYDEVPQELRRAMWRLKFPSSYVVVGAYRLFTDKSLYIPAWTKCRNGARRGLICGFAWVSGNISRLCEHAR